MDKNVLFVLLLALSCNLDNIAIGISYGVRNIRLPWLSNLLIAFLTGFGTWLFIVFGQRIISYISPKIAVLAASLILIGMGVWVLWQEFGNYTKGTETEAAEQRSRPEPGRTCPAVTVATDDPYSQRIRPLPIRTVRVIST